MQATALSPALSRLRPLAAWCAAMAACSILQGCASAPSRTPPLPASSASTDCAELGRQVAALEQQRQDAAARRSGAWKAVVPFAVAGRYASGRSAEAEAQRGLEAARQQMVRQGCAPAA